MFSRDFETVTSQCPSASTDSVLRNESPLTDPTPAIDRLVHHCVILELNVPSYRAEQAKKGRQTPIAAE